MPAKLLLLALAMTTSGCAPGRQLEGAPDDFAAPQDVQLVVRNEAPAAVTVFVWWEGGSRIRLGELRGNSERTFTTPHRDTGMWLSVDVLSNRGVGRGNAPRSFIPIDPGDRLEWQIRRVDPLELFWRRLQPM